MLRINNHKVNFSLAVVGYVHEGEIKCPTCQGQDDKSARLYGSEGRGQACATCGTPIRVDVVLATRE